MNTISPDNLPVEGFGNASPFASQFRRKVETMVPLGEINNGNFNRKVKPKKKDEQSK